MDVLQRCVFLCLYFLSCLLVDWKDGFLMTDLVFTITQLDKPEGYTVGRKIILLKNDENFCKLLTSIINNKNIKGTYTTVKEVHYA